MKKSIRMLFSKFFLLLFFFSPSLPTYIRAVLSIPVIGLFSYDQFLSLSLSPFFRKHTKVRYKSDVLLFNYLLSCLGSKRREAEKPKREKERESTILMKGNDTKQER